MTILSYLKFSILKSLEPVPKAFINVTISFEDIILDKAFVEISSPLALPFTYVFKIFPLKGKTA